MDSTVLVATPAISVVCLPSRVEAERCGDRPYAKPSIKGSKYPEDQMHQSQTTDGVAWIIHHCPKV